MLNQIEWHFEITSDLKMSFSSSTALLAEVYSIHIFSPVKNTVVVNDRWGEGIAGKHGGFLTYSDHFDPGLFFSKFRE